MMPRKSDLAREVDRHESKGLRLIGLWNILPKDAKITDRDKLECLEGTAKWLEEGNTLYKNPLDVECMKVLMEYCRLRSQYAKLMIQGLEEPFLNWVAELFREKKLQRLGKRNSSLVQLVEQVLIDLETYPFLELEDPYSRKHYTEKLEVLKTQGILLKEFQEKIEFYLPQAVMRREN